MAVRCPNRPPVSMLPSVIETPAAPGFSRREIASYGPVSFTVEWNLLEVAAAKPSFSATASSQP